jgi:hypothetical protein
MENLVIAKIDVSRPSGRKIIRELEGKKSVELEDPMPDDIAAAIAGRKTYTIEDVFERIEKKMNAFYGTNIKLKYT